MAYQCSDHILPFCWLEFASNSYWMLIIITLSLNESRMLRYAYTYTDPRALLHLIESVADLYSDEREDCEDEAGQTQQDQQCHLDVTLNVNSIYKLFRNHCVCSPRSIPTTDLFTFALSRISIMSQGPYVKARHGSEVHR